MSETEPPISLATQLPARFVERPLSHVGNGEHRARADRRRRTTSRLRATLRPAAHRATPSPAPSAATSTRCELRTARHGNDPGDGSPHVGRDGPIAGRIRSPPCIHRRLAVGALWASASASASPASAGPQQAVPRAQGSASHQRPRPPPGASCCASAATRAAACPRLRVLAAVLVWLGSRQRPWRLCSTHPRAAESYAVLVLVCLPRSLESPWGAVGAQQDPTGNGPVREWAGRTRHELE